MPIGTPLNLTLNPDGQSDWGGNERTILQALIDVVEAQVSVDGLNVNGALSFHGHPLTNASYLGLTAAGNSAVNRSYWFDSSGEAWVTDGNGNAVQLTSGGSLNVGGSSGGFYGDYVASAGNARATYTSANSTFDFRSSPGVAALVEHGDLRLRQGSVSDAVVVKAPANLAGSYSLTLPDALPASRQIVQVDATGTVTLSNVITSDVTLSASLRTSGTITWSSQTFLFNPSGATAYGGSTYSGDGTINLLAGSQVDHALDGIEPGTRIIQIDAFLKRNGSTPMTASLYFRGVDSGFAQLIAQRSVNTGSGVMVHTLGAGIGILTGTLPHVASRTGSYFVRIFDAGASGTPDVYLGCRVVADKVS